jgi:hypothetical protein
MVSIACLEVNRCLSALVGDADVEGVSASILSFDGLQDSEVAIPAGVGEVTRQRVLSCQGLE